MYAIALARRTLHGFALARSTLYAIVLARRTLYGSAPWRQLGRLSLAAVMRADLVRRLGCAWLCDRDSDGARRLGKDGARRLGKDGARRLGKDGLRGRQHVSARLHECVGRREYKYRAKFKQERQGVTFADNERLYPVQARLVRG
jgi:hypothetical protein